MKRTIKHTLNNTKRTCGTLLAFMIGLMLTANVQAGEVLFSFDSHNSYIQEGEQLYVIPSSLFRFKYGKLMPGDHVSLQKSELKFLTYEMSKPTKEEVANRNVETTFSNYGGRVYAFSAPYYYLMKAKVHEGSQDLRISPRNVEYTWAPEKAKLRTHANRGPAAIKSESYKFNSDTVFIQGTRVKSESAETVAVKSKNAIFWLKKEALKNTQSADADNLEFEVDHDQILWIAAL